MNVLVLYDKFSTYTNTVFEHLDSTRKFSSHPHVFCHGGGRAPKIYWSEFDVLVIHYSLRIGSGTIHPRLIKEIGRFHGLKVIFVQDEYDHTERTRSAIENLGVKIVFTCVPAAHRELIYPSSRFSTVIFIETLTGYAPECFEELQKSPPIDQRSIMIAYRGRVLPYWYGDLGQEKQNIAMVVRKQCEEKGLSCDIEWDDAHRIYGDCWLEFLQSCKATLGTESGSNLFDHDGKLKDRFSLYLRKNPDATYVQAKSAVLGNIKEDPIMNQVSPRIFEAIASKTALILFEGEYSGVVQPDKHYLSLKKDFTNLNEIFENLTDNQYLQEMVDRAYRDVIESGNYSFSRFVKQYDDILMSELNHKVMNSTKNIRLNSAITSLPERLPPSKAPEWIVKIWRVIPANIRQRIKPDIIRWIVAIVRK